MKALAISLLITSISGFTSSISGKVEFKGKPLKGTLFVFARKYQSQMPMPLAVKKITSPSYPVSFSLSQQDAMIKEMPFKGPFQIVARISPSGDPLDKSGKEVSTVEPVKLGTKELKLEFK